MGELGFESEQDSHGMCQRCEAKANHESFGDPLPDWYEKGLEAAPKAHAADELVRAVVDLARADGSVAVPKGTSGIVRGRDESGEFYWVLFKGADDAIPAREGEIQRLDARTIRERSEE